MTYLGVVYNIPVDVFMPLSFPFDAPIIYVRPTSQMMVTVGHTFVEPDGFVRMREMLHKTHFGEWAEHSSLTRLLQAIGGAFGREPPLFTRPARPTTQQRSSPQTQTEVRVINAVILFCYFSILLLLFHAELCIRQLRCSSVTIYTNNIITHNHHTDIYPFNYFLQTQGGAQYQQEWQQLHGRQGGASASSNSTNGSNSNDSNMDTSAGNINNSSGANNQARENNRGGNYSQSVSDIRRNENTSNTAQAQTGNGVGSSSSSGASNTNNLSRTELEQIITEKLQIALLEDHSLTRSELDQAMSDQNKLQECSDTVSEQLVSLAHMESDLEKAIVAVAKKNEAFSVFLAREAEGGEPDLEARLVPHDKLSAQMITLSAEHAAIDDCMYYMEKALASMEIPSFQVSQFLKQTRQLARSQYDKKAHLNKISNYLARLSAEDERTVVDR